MLLDFVYTAVSWVLLRWHQLFTLFGLPATSGLTWALSIVLLVVTARVLLFPFFLSQLHYQRRMQALQPQLQETKERHRGDRQAQQRAVLALQQREGFNPLAGCLPILLQIPVFLALFHVLRHVSNAASLCHPPQVHKAVLALYGFTPVQTCSAANATLFGAPLAGTLTDSRHTIESVLGGSYAVMVSVTVVVVIISAGCVLHPTIGAPEQSQPAGRPPGRRAEPDRGRHPDVRGDRGSVLPARRAPLLVHQQRLDPGQQLHVGRFHPHVERAVPRR